MAGDTVQEVKSRLSIVDVVSPYVKLLRAGMNFKARCPFHSEKTPSFLVSPERGTYHCFGCGVGGDMFTFVQEIEGVDFKGALKILAEKAGVPLVYSRGEKKDPANRLYEALEEATRFFESNLNNDKSDLSLGARAYLKKRGLAEETISSFRLGWAMDEWRALTEHLRGRKFTDVEIEAAGLAKKPEKNQSSGIYDRFRSRIIFPLFDSAGRVVGFSGRIFGDNQPADAAKYLNSPETALYHKSKLLYGYDRAKQHIRKHDFSTLVEGQMDLLMAHQAGWPNAVAVSGTALTQDHISTLMRMSENMVLALDADKAGVDAARRAAQVALSMGMDVKVARLPQGSDPADFLLAEGKEGWKKSIREAKHVVEFLLDALAGQQKDERSYAKVVRAQVLPFIAMIKSPIDRDHFINLVSERLHVSENSVREEVGFASEKNIPNTTTNGSGSTTIYSSAGDDDSARRSTRGRSMTPRVRQAFGVALWQAEMKKPLFSKAEIDALMSDAAGKDAAELLGSIPEESRERFRFEAEQRFAHAKDLQKEIELLFRLMKIDRLRAELKSPATPEEQSETAKKLQTLLADNA